MPQRTHGTRPNAPHLVAALTALGLLVVASAGRAAAPSATRLHRATTHLMRYHLALPAHWAPGGSWPVVVVIPDAAREFADNLDKFVVARGERPFILVAPEVLTCGGARTRTREYYDYSATEWDSLAHGDDFAFDDAGLAAVLADVHREWGGEPTAFLTGWEAGGHTVWAQALRRPERWRAVAPVTTNYQRRGLTDGTFSRAPERARLPIRAFRCGAPRAEIAGLIRFVDQQVQQAMADARAHGFNDVALEVVPGADHGPLPDTVLAWFASRLAPASRRG